jgi:predicted helicase
MITLKFLSVTGNISLRKMAVVFWPSLTLTAFLDNPTFRGMRWHLLKTYDKIYTIDLHGNSKKKGNDP